MIALAMILAPRDEEAALLDRCLSSVRPHVENAFITITGENKEVERVCRKHDCVISHYEWHDDFAAARNYNFSQVPQEYTHIIWLDADDVVVGAKNIKNVAKKMDELEIDGVAPWYMYAFDEHDNVLVQHRKVRMVRNNWKMGWSKQAGELHEDLQPNGEAKLAKLNKEEKKLYFEVHHLRDDARIRESAERNIRISKTQTEKNPEDPRVWWNYANSLSALHKRDEALEAYKKFLSFTKSETEAYVAKLRMAAIEKDRGNLHSSEELALSALIQFPHIPDSYLLLGSVAYLKEQWKNAKEFIVMGMTKKPEELLPVHTPRDYDQAPMELLVKVYAFLGELDSSERVVRKLIEMFPRNKRYPELLSIVQQEQKKLREVEQFLAEHEDSKREQTLMDYNLAPEYVRMHPAVCALKNSRCIRETSPGDEVVIYCGPTGHSWNRESSAKGIGGSEEAVLELSRRWTKEGKRVVVYCSCGGQEQVDEYGVEWKPYWLFNPRDLYDVLIVWRNPFVLDHKFNARVVILDMHDVIPATEMTEERLKNVDKIHVKSQYQRNLFPKIPDNKFRVIGNGIDCDSFTLEQKIPYSMIYTSSYDRGLEHLLVRWGELRKELPGATLDICYGWGIFDNVHRGNPERMAWKEKMAQLMKQDGITESGKVGHKEVAERMSRTSVFAYPCHFEEIFCISAVKAQAAGNRVVTTDYAALPEVVKNGNLVQGDVKKEAIWDGWLRVLVSTLKKRESDSERDAIRSGVLDFDWDLISSKWLDEMV